MTLVAFEVPLTVMELVETVSLEVGSVMTISDFVVSAGFLSTATILMVFMIPSGGTSRSMKSISYSPAFLSVNHFCISCSP